MDEFNTVPRGVPCSYRNPLANDRNPLANDRNPLANALRVAGHDSIGQWHRIPRVHKREEAITCRGLNQWSHTPSTYPGFETSPCPLWRPKLPTEARKGLGGKGAQIFLSVLTNVERVTEIYNYTKKWQ